MKYFNESQLLISGTLFGIIWLVQLLIYPSFLFFSKEAFKKSMKHHQDKISLLIVPLMLSELFLAIMGVLMNTSPTSVSILCLVILIWLTTFTIHVPLHSQLLENGFDEKKINRLVKTNWSRTIIWTIKLFIVFNAL